ncbi:glucose-6-phosphate dehydrogenase [uncultured Paracoccus sp.]|uniref:glucose-6-phosphate dehydrogenase n=1 Tax=uncultured Paracoccus sp. TaxID=189685 RepID=UPI00260F06F0|nr:glucose-6-phosphate dehydrogenase [uncultured Paracoccus sp.]
MVSRVIPVEAFDLVIFGATGDLAQRKILPGLFRRFVAGQMPDDARIIGSARTRMEAGEFRDQVRAAIAAHDGPRIDHPQLDAFLQLLDYVPLDAGAPDGWADLRGRLRPDVVRAVYFSVAPSLFATLVQGMSEQGLADADTRIVVEKPFGHDLASARALNEMLSQHFSEAQIYRIDHYLGKETVQNLMAVRFANILLEPLWNAHYVDHVQITVAETVGVAGRGGYYDDAGAMRDMVQNHLMQLLCLIAMEPPVRFDPDAVRDEKLKVLRALAPVAPDDIVRGQYRGAGAIAGYAEDVDNPDSRTESFVALKVRLVNWRWQGTPFYLRTGKRLRARASEIAIVFRMPPHSIFDTPELPRANELVIRLQPDEGMDLKMMIKEPGPGGMRLVPVALDMSFAEALGEDGVDLPDAYERLIMDVIRGNQTLFMRGDEVEAAWAWTDPVVDAWAAGTARPEPYDPGSAGPDAATQLMQRDGRRWRDMRN